MLADSGIWEVRNDPNSSIWWAKGVQHFTYSKIMCYVAISSAIELGKAIGKSFHPNAVSLMKFLKAEILKNSWDKIKKSYVQQYGHSPVDISVLALGEYKIVPNKSKRYDQTIDVIAQKLNMFGGIKRHEDAVMPFYLPTFWLAQHFLQKGKMKEAKKLINVAMKNASKLGLFAEHFNPEERKQYGNYPQSFCAASFVEAIILLDKKLETMKVNPDNKTIPHYH